MILRRRHSQFYDECKTINPKNLTPIDNKRLDSSNTLCKIKPSKGDK